MGFPLALWKPSGVKADEEPMEAASLALMAEWPRTTEGQRLSSGQTIGAARTAVRSACLPELRIISAFGSCVP